MADGELSTLPSNVATIKKEYCFTFCKSDGDYVCRVKMTDYFGLVTALGVENLEQRNGDAFLLHQVDTPDELYARLILEYPAPEHVILRREERSFTKHPVANLHSKSLTSLLLELCISLKLISWRTIRIFFVTSYVKHNNKPLWQILVE
jgi:hypothetical protein